MNHETQPKQLSESSMKAIDMLKKIAKCFTQISDLCVSYANITDSNRAEWSTISDQLGINRQKLKYLDSQELLDKDQKQLSTLCQSIKKNKPKHPNSSFFCFFKEKNREIAQGSKETQGSKIAKLVGESWKKLSFEERKPYEERSQRQRKEYELSMRNYRAYYAKEFADYQKLKRFKKLEKQKKKRELKKLNLKASSLEEVSNQHKYVGGEWTQKPIDEESDLLSDSHEQNKIGKVEQTLNNQLDIAQ